MSTHTPLTLGVGVLGYAGVARAHFNALRKLPYIFPDPPVRLRLVGIAGRSSAGAQEAARRYGFDGVLLNLPGRDPHWRRHVARIETAADCGQTVYFNNGESARCPADDNVQHTAPGRQAADQHQISRADSQYIAEKNVAQVDRIGADAGNQRHAKRESG